MIVGITASVIKVLNNSNVVLLLKMNGITGSNVFIDDSPTHKQVIANGGAVIVSDGYGSRLYLTGSNSSLRVNSNKDFIFGIDDFTISANVVITGGQPYARLVYFGDYWHNYNSFGILAKDADHPGKITFASYKLGQSRLLVSTTTIQPNVNYHVRVSRKNGIFRLFINGNLEAINDAYVGVSIDSVTTNTVAVGSAYAPNVEEQLNGYVDNVEIVKGLSLSDSNFTPPA